MLGIFRRFFNVVDKLSTPTVILLISSISISIKMGYILTLGGGLGTLSGEATDAVVHNQIALNLLRTGVFGVHLGIASVGVPPGEALFLAMLYSISNYSIAFAKLVHVTLLTLGAGLTFLIGKEIAGPFVGFWAGVFLAIDPAQAYLSGTFLTEPLYIFLILMAVYGLNRYHTRPRMGWLIVAAICLGLGGLTRNEGWLFAVALFGGAILTRGKLLPVRSAAIMLIVCIGVITPWTIRNYQVAGRFVLVSSNAGLTLWSANNPEFVWRQPMPMSLPIYDAPPGLSDTQLDQYYRQRAIEWITGHPVDFIVNGFRKLIVLFSFDPLSARPQVATLYRIAGLFPYGVLLPFILVGLLLNLRNPYFAIILWYILFTMAMAVVFWGDSRIRAPIQPYLYLFGVLGLQAFCRWLQSWHSRWFGGVRFESGENK